ncbi:MAG: Rha family transcriptional regulator [Bacteroidota bacterium]|nr:Rha family transcriptional regulator [Bacteroidota bacterium]
MDEVINYVSIENGKSVTTSIQVALRFGKQHKNVLRNIRDLNCSPEFHRLNFETILIIRQLPNGSATNDDSYKITKDGFTFLVMGFTGKEAAKFNEAYFGEFNARGREIYAMSKRVKEIGKKS